MVDLGPASIRTGSSRVEDHRRRGAGNGEHGREQGGQIPTHHLGDQHASTCSGVARDRLAKEASGDRMDEFKLLISKMARPISTPVQAIYRADSGPSYAPSR